MTLKLLKAATFGLAAFSAMLWLSDPQLAHAQKGLFKNKPKEPAKPIEDKPLTQDETAFFEKKIRPILVEKCYACHTAETPKGPKGSLILDTKAGMAKGGDTGPAVAAGSAKKSLILKAMKGDELSQMPPKEKLSAEVVADFEKWIAMGAPDPRAGKAGPMSKPIDIAKGKEHWAFQPVKSPDVPKLKGQPANPVDAFVLKTLTDKGLSAAVPAERATLLRRIYFDLIGLPPTPDQLDAFLKDMTAKAVEKVIDQLLASTQFGERWGRHWLDVARYAESSGKEVNMVYPFAWRYRDYVIAAFNKDLPYDRFVKEQLAGDLLPSRNDAEKAERLVATGYLAIGAKSHNERNARQFQLDLADEQIDAFSQGMLGITISCARCHDHKFDPIPTTDYYAIAGIFTSTETKFGTARSIQSIQAAPLIELPASAEAGSMLTKGEWEKLKARLTDLKKQREDAIEAGKKDPQINIRQLVANAQIATVEKQLSYYDAEGVPKKMAMGVGDRTFTRDLPVYTRGELTKPGEIVPRGFAQVIAPAAPKIRGGSGRLELAEWVASPSNPLTARVYVNRIWGHLFGRGLVASMDNFGTAGQKPTHPELLDYLAGKFMKNGWSTKSLIKELMLSRTYQQASTHSDANAATDPDNEYLWRMSKRRLDAEAIRDAMLAVSGELDKAPPVGSPLQKIDGPTPQLGRFGNGLGDVSENRKRSVYIPILRDLTPESLDLFDFPDASLASGSRDGTSVPSQALYLMNNATVMKMAEKGAEKLIAKYQSPTERIEAAFKLAFGRAASKTEATVAEQFLDKMKRSTRVGGEKAAWSALLQALYGTAEFRYLD